MSDKNHDQFIENLLDASLARYSAVTPHAGLEGRILANASAAQERSSWTVWAWWMAAGAVAAVIAVGAFNFMYRSAIPAPPHAVEVSKAGETVKTGPSPFTAPPEPVPAARRPSVQRATRVPAAREADDPRLAVFPSPRPPTQQEELVLQLARSTPASALSAFPTETREIADLEIKALEIAPLDSEETEIKNKQ